MGQVYEATDQRTGEADAIKVLRDDGAHTPNAARFAAEIALLAELTHPGIVRYVAHGVTPDDQPFLAMERLAGEDLGARLARGVLSLAEALRLVERVASALGEAHQRGIVHRDLKPSNLFLRERTIEGITLLDFGIARRAGADRSLTRTGAVMGTPDYMAPEQARGAPDVGPAADVFALGAILYQCLTGRPPFAGEHVMATLAKILFEEPVPLTRIRPDVPPGLAFVVAQMLDKRKEHRLPDAGAVLSAVAGLRSGLGDKGAPVPLGLGGTELELVSVIVGVPPTTNGGNETIAAGTGDTLPLGAPAGDPPGADSVLRALAAQGVPAQALADGSIIGTLSGGHAVDQALAAVSCARMVQARWPEARVAVATARRVAGSRLPVGEALDRAAALLAAQGPAAPGGRVMLDDVTAGLLDGRVRTTPTGPGWATLHDAPSAADTTRLLLGRATPCVGREQELGMIEMTLAASVNEGVARALLVTAPAGLGKSRLRHELLRNLDRAEVGRRPRLTLEGRGELLRSETPHALLSGAVRRLFGLEGGGGAPADLLAHVEAFLPDPLAVAEILGELCDVPFRESLRLRAARQDPRVMQARIVDAVLTLLEGMCATHDVLLILEDLHWADRPSVALIDAALRRLEDQPLMVLGLARPEVNERFPGLWKGRVVELPLRPLSRRACERLVTGVAGDRLAPEAIRQIAERSDGNALYLEELVRAACDGHAGTHPVTLLAMLQARIGHLAPGERRALRAASVYGESFLLEGVCAVLGPTVDEATVERSLASLVREEILEPRRDAPGHRFRHSLMRDAAYGLLVDDDLRVGHRLAAAFLADRESDAAVIAEHFLRSDHPDEAVPWFVRAAQRAHDRDDYGACEQLVLRGRAAGAAGPALGALAALAAFAAVMRWSWTTADVAATEALALLAAGSAYWCHAQRVVVQLAAYRNEPESLRSCLAQLRDATPADDRARLVWCDSALHAASSAIQAGLPGPGRELLEAVERRMCVAEDDGGALSPTLPAWRKLIRCTLHRHTDDDLGAQLVLLGEAIRTYEAAGVDGTMLILAHDVLGEVESRAGLVEQGITRVRASFARARKLGASLVISHARLSLANVLLARNTPEAYAEAAQLANDLLATPGLSAGYQAMARDVLAHAVLGSGDPTTAAVEARTAIALSPHTPVRRWLMVAHLTEALSALGELDAAWRTAATAFSEIDASGFRGGYAELPLLRAAVTAASASGRDTSGLTAQIDAWCSRQAASLADGEVRAGYLRHVRVTSSAAG